MSSVQKEREKHEEWVKLDASTRNKIFFLKVYHQYYSSTLLLQKEIKILYFDTKTDCNAGEEGHSLLNQLFIYIKWSLNYQYGRNEIQSITMRFTQFNGIQLNTAVN